jgi:2-oxo-4-hydroxy-4-carboxy-5-ureidoimidazoline decarboxylase
VTVEALDGLPIEEARAVLERCCSASRWVERMCAARPFRRRATVFGAAAEAFRGFARADWLEAFAGHPRIGDLESLRARFAATAAWAGEEQRGAAAASEATLAALAEGNRAYEEKFGYIFIVCATGLSAERMLASLRSRLANAAQEELGNAAEEQMKITRLRLEKLVDATA